MGERGEIFISNTLFDTTRANIEFSGAEGIDLVCEEGKHPAIPAPLKATWIIVALKKVIKEKGAENIPMVIPTVTNNSGGGQPVSMKISERCKICKQYKILFIDCCFCRKCLFHKLREKDMQKQVIDIHVKCFSYADGANHER